MTEKREYDKIYHSKNKDKIKEWSKRYYQKNREKILQQQKEDYQQNKEKKKQYEKEYYQKNREKILERSKIYSQEYYLKNKNKILKNNKEWFRKNPEYRKKYNRKRLQNLLENEWKPILNKMFGELKCPLCGYDKSFYAICFHHRDPKKKIYSPSSLLHKKPTPERIKEFKKCDMLCSNCHLEKTFS